MEKKYKKVGKCKETETRMTITKRQNWTKTIDRHETYKSIDAKFLI